MADNEDYSKLTFWLLFIVGMILVVGLYNAFMGPLSTGTPLTERTKKKPVNVKDRDQVPKSMKRRKAK